MREPYFDGHNITWNFRNPWKVPVHLNGSDGLSIHPGINEEEQPWTYVDDIYRTAVFELNSTKIYNKLKVNRYMY